jgi:hypothetical protein
MAQTNNKPKKLIHEKKTIHFSFQKESAKSLVGETSSVTP